MEKRTKRKSPSVKLPPHGDASQHPNGHAPQPVGPDITDLVNKMSQQLVFLEKKIDTLIDQSSERPYQHFDKTQHRRFDRSKRTFNQAICADCGKTCKVPFKPSGDRPVYCSECFSKRQAGGSPKGNRDNRPRKPFSIRQKAHV